MESWRGFNGDNGDGMEPRTSALMEKTKVKREMVETEKNQSKRVENE